MLSFFSRLPLCRGANQRGRGEGRKMDTKGEEGRTKKAVSL